MIDEVLCVALINGPMMMDAIMLSILRSMIYDLICVLIFVSCLMSLILSMSSILHLCHPLLIDVLNSTLCI